ncbi:MAG: glycerate kinase, partial [Lachnospiraceae bacterium]|nr:glycerate kinase [Lachnospiraceae bacterium]
MNKKVIIIPDSFKGSLTSEEAAAILKKSAENAGFEALAFPIADGGEGSVNSILSVKGGTRFFKTVTGPDGNDIEAMYGITSDNIAVIEIAESSGITKQKEPHPMTAGTFGFGSLIRDALDRGARKFLLCLGGSASTDCGTGMAAALGVVFLNEKKESFVPCGETLSDIANVDISGLDKRISESSFCVMTDVTNPLYGPEGAAYVFAPQKGADPEQVKKLDMGLKNAAEHIEKATGT